MALGPVRRGALLLGYAAYAPSTLVRSSEKLAVALRSLPRHVSTSSRVGRIAGSGHHT